MKSGLIALLLIISFALSGCSTVMAARQPNKKDVSVFNTGTLRNKVIAEVGNPVSSEEVDGKLVDVFSFTQGYHKGAKAGRVLAHGAADVLTLGLWELVGTPTESIFDGTEVKLEVHYDEGNRVKKVIPYKGEQVLKTIDSTQE